MTRKEYTVEEVKAMPDDFAGCRFDSLLGYTMAEAISRAMQRGKFVGIVSEQIGITVIYRPHENP